MSSKEKDSIANKLFSSLLKSTKSAQFLTPADLPFYHSTLSGFTSQLESVQSKLVQLINKTLEKAVPIRPPFIKNAQDLKTDYDKMTDTIDHLLEQVDIYLDEASGKNKKVSDIVLNPSSLDTKYPSQATVHHKPQNHFKDKIDNSNTPFKWRITFKPNAKRPLDYGLESESISEEMGQHLQSLGIASSSALLASTHPYEYEINTLTHPEFMFKIAPEILYQEIQKTPLAWIDSLDKLQELQEYLETVDEIAIDLEHHSYRSFQGFTCLMQISTRTRDFILDTLVLRDSLHILNTCFTNPNIIKVFHGAEMDIQWLQRDFGLYIVNLFDTFHASHVLELQGHGLAFLLKHYCDVNTNKKYQLADWRIRPVPDDMLHYARTDTHYLLYIYDRMRNELISTSDPQTLNLLTVVLSRSCETSLKLYVKDLYDSENGEGPSGWKNTIKKFNRSMNVEKFAVFRALHAWRDHIGRKEDESLHYVMPNYVLFNLVENMPTNPEQVLGCCNPIPRLVRVYSKELADLIANCKLETERNQKLKEKELAKLNAAMEAKEKEWEERRLKGPMHIRFNNADQEDAASLLNASTEMDIEIASNLTVSGNERKKHKIMNIQTKSESLLFGNCLIVPCTSSNKVMQIKKKIETSRGLQEQELIEKIQKIQSVLSLAAVEKHQDSNIPLSEEKVEVKETIPMSIEKEHAPPTTPSLKRKQVEFKTIEIQDESISIIANVGKKKKKSKNKNKKGNANAVVEPQDVISLDFAKSKSVIAKQFEQFDD